MTAPSTSDRVTGDFYPRPPRGGRPLHLSTGIEIVPFLPTPSARRATFENRRHPRADSNFYPRPPRGGRRGRRQGVDHYRNFYPRPPRGGRPRYLTSRPVSLYFYPRPPRGGRPDCLLSACTKNNFYPRPPRGGRPSQAQTTAEAAQISTHALREEGDQPPAHPTG